MAFLVGALLALAVGLFATLSRLDRDRAFYPTVTIVIASYYCLFAVMGGSARALVLESLVAGAFLSVAVLGFRSSLGLCRLPWLHTGCSTLPIARSCPIRGSPPGGQHSVLRTMSRPEATWRGCSRAAAFALQPSWQGSS
jgi:hypothetical protein